MSSDPISIYVDGRSFGKKYGSSFAIVLHSGPHVWQRSFDCGGVTGNEAALRSVQYALSSVKVEHRKKQIILITNSKYVYTMLEKEESGHWKKNARANAALVDNIRNTLDNYPNIKICETSEEDFNTKVRSLSEMIAKERKAVNLRS